MEESGKCPQFPQFLMLPLLTVIISIFFFWHRDMFFETKRKLVLWRSAGDMSRHITTHNIKLLWREIQNEYRTLTYHLKLSLPGPKLQCVLVLINRDGIIIIYNYHRAGDGFYQHSNMN